MTLNKSVPYYTGRWVINDNFEFAGIYDFSTTTAVPQESNLTLRYPQYNEGKAAFEKQWPIPITFLSATIGLCLLQKL